MEAVFNMRWLFLNMQVKSVNASPGSSDGAMSMISSF